MAFDRDFHEVLDEFAMMDSARQNDENSQLYKDKIDMMNLEVRLFFWETNDFYDFFMIETFLLRKTLILIKFNDYACRNVREKQ